MANTTSIISPLVLSGPMDVADSPYNYIPTRSVAIIFVALFGLSSLTHTIQALYFRMWWLFPTVCLAGAVEVLGWSGRLWSSFSPSFGNPFLIQITSTILAPTPLVAANFVILGRIIRRLGPSYSRLSPKYYTIVFCCFDVVSLVIQGTGGGIASNAIDNAGSTLGANIMLGGIVFQLVTITIYVCLAAEFFVRYFKDIPFRRAASTGVDGNPDLTRGFLDKKLKTMTIALIFNTTCLFIRSVYRTIELSDGWNGRIISTQVYFNVLDGAMVVLAIITLNVAHPGFLLGSQKPPKGSSVDMRSKMPLDDSNGSLA